MFASFVPDSIGAKTAWRSVWLARFCGTGQEIPYCRDIARHVSVDFCHDRIAKIGRQAMDLLARGAQGIWRTTGKSMIYSVLASLVHGFFGREHPLQAAEKTQIDGINHRAQSLCRDTLANDGAIS